MAPVESDGATVVSRCPAHFRTMAGASTAVAGADGDGHPGHRLGRGLLGGINGPIGHPQRHRLHPRASHAAGAWRLTRSTGTVPDLALRAGASPWPDLRTRTPHKLPIPAPP
jgi:hypothetical protein